MSKSINSSPANVFDEKTLSARRRARPPRTACVLVVEDHEDTRFLLRTMLERRDLRVIEAADGMEAVAAAESAHPDLILMDSGLPSLDGIGATRRIRLHAGARGVPIIFLSGHAMPALRDAAFDAGCDAYLLKPIDFSEWDRVLNQYLPQSLFKGKATS